MGHNEKLRAHPSTGKEDLVGAQRQSDMMF